MRSLVRYPVEALRSFRRILTPASVTLILVGIVTLNVVWGYPWAGMFSACFAMFFLGLLASRIFRPRWTVSVVCPASSPAGQPFGTRVHVQNVSSFPSLDTSIELQSRRREGARDKNSPAALTDLGESHRLSWLGSGESADFSFFVGAERRGIHPVPGVTVESTFPFYLFRSTRRYQPTETIAITPRLLSDDEDDQSHRLLMSVGAWTRRMLSGDSMEYTGSREYQTGMPVRRWDFASWARLNRPIVREFSAPSVQEVTLIVDTSLDEPDGRHSIASGGSVPVDPSLELLLSVAATALTRLSAAGFQIRMAVSGEDDSDQSNSPSVAAASTLEPLLIRLAVAERVDQASARPWLEETIASDASQAMLLLRTGGYSDEVPALPARAVVLPVGYGEDERGGQADARVPAGGNHAA